MDVVRKGYSVIKRISLLLAVALMVVTMLAATAAPSFAGVKSECTGTWIQSTKSCEEPNNARVSKGTDYENAGNGGDDTKYIRNPSGTHTTGGGG